MDDCALKCVESAYIMERRGMAESDHAAVGVNVEWTAKRRMKCRRKRKSTQKMKAHCKKLGCFGSQMEEREYKDLSSMNVAMAQMGVELNKEMDKWCKNRGGCQIA